MKRSEINHKILEAIDFFHAMNFKLPRWAYWSPADWIAQISNTSEVRENMLGWDITDFGSGDFRKRGLFLFTIRNGNPQNDRKPYAEKIMIVEEGQETPMHYHWHKMEDIINRGGGNLVIDLYNSTPDGELANTHVEVKIDGVLKKVPAGGQVILIPGDSICLQQGIYHRFYGQIGGGRVLVGEVSAVNDDHADNRFLESIGRFPDIIEDQEPVHLLVCDYKKYAS